jgi:low affinity Fe/Cu permease
MTKVFNPPEPPQKQINERLRQTKTATAAGRLSEICADGRADERAFFHFNNPWLPVIDTVGNLIAFLMIFLIRNAQNRESEAVHLKLDELIRATKSAHNSLLDIEELSEEDLNWIKERFERLARKARAGSGGQTEFVSKEKQPDAPVIAQHKTIKL